MIKSRTAWGITIVAKSKCVATGSRFWTIMIATKMARIEATMIFKLRIKSKKGLSAILHLCETPARERGNGWPPRNIWIDDELKHPNAIEIYFVLSFRPRSFQDYHRDARVTGAVPIANPVGPP